MVYMIYMMYIYIYITSQKSAIQTFCGGAVSCCSVWQFVAVCCSSMPGRPFAST